MHDEQALEVVRASDNVFEDLGFGGEEAENLKIRADLMLDLRRYIQDRGWTREESAAFFAEPGSRISSLMDGEIGDFTIDGLIAMLAKAGMRIRVQILPAAA